MGNPSLAQKSVVITGGTSGIGLGIARLFASQDSRISILSSTVTPGHPIVSSLRAEFPSVTFLFKKCDISSWEDQKAAFEEIYQEFGSIDIVFANAGITEKGAFFLEREEEPAKPNLRTMEVNLTGTLYTVKLGVHYMRKKEAAYKGSIICTSSDAGIYPLPTAPIYATTKHAIVGAVRSLAGPLELDGIQINTIAPGVIATNLAPDQALLDSMIHTPMSTLLDALLEFVTNVKLTGVTAEISGENIVYREPPEYVDEATKRNFETFERLGYA